MASTEELEQFRAAVEENERRRIIHQCGSLRGNEQLPITSLHPRQKYICVDVGGPVHRHGRYMIEKASDLVYGIKAYGVIHRGHCYGTVQEFTQRLLA